MSRVWTEDAKRLFVALDLPRDAAREVSLWQDEALEGQRELRLMGTIHLTLAFLGQVLVARIPMLTETLTSIRFDPLRLTIEDVIFLPERGAKRVIALRLGGDDGALLGLQAEVSATLAERGLYKPEKRPFLPHVTVARYRNPGQPFPLQNVNISEFGVDQMVLYSSLLQRGGAVHTPLAVFPASR